MQMRPVCDNGGVVLLIVLWVLVLLSVIAGEFSYTMSNQVRMVSNFKESAQAYYIAVGGINQAIYQILQVENQNRTAPDSGGSARQGDSLPGTWRINGTTGPIAMGDHGSLKVHIRNEGGKIDINRAESNLLHVLLRPFGLEESRESTIVDSILDWRDENSLHRASGAEDDYYRALAEPYECRDGPFRKKEELLLVRGVTPKLYYGGLEEMVTVLPGQKKEEFTGLTRLLRNFGNTGKGGAGGLNINAVPPRLLGAFPDIQPETVETILSYRQAQEIRSLSELAAVLDDGQFEIVRRHFTAEALPYYRIWAMGYTQNNVKETIEVLVRVNPGGEEPYQILEWNDAVR